jgi:hypothetical protein
MTTLAYSELVRRADELQVEEQLRLAAYLLERARQMVAVEKPKRKWRELRGLAKYPMLGEDAQEWVSRTRRESDEQRQAQWSDME